MPATRREFLAAAAAAPVVLAPAADPAPPHVVTNVYPWRTFYQRDKKDFNASLDAGLAEVRAAGLDGFEPVAESPEQVKALAPLLKKHGLELRSVYVNSTLHDAKAAAESVAGVLATAAEAAKLGCKVVVTNPSPIKWGGPENKTDDQLKVQAENLGKLGAGLRKAGLVLAYHNHDSELRLAAREFHHMLAGTDPGDVKFCLDAHWVFRGAGDSQVALFDAVKLYGKRVVELHLRQSKGGVWTEAFGDGDLDYRRLAAELTKLGVRPHVVLEQAVEAKSPRTMTALEAHKAGTPYAREVFKGF
jgi:inosose dehydratase